MIVRGTPRHNEAQNKRDMQAVLENILVSLLLSVIVLLVEGNRRVPRTIPAKRAPRDPRPIARGAQAARTRRPY
jgi:hypothetical protein